MLHRLCPRCAKLGRFIELATQPAYAEHYRCDPCDCTWDYPRNATARAVEDRRQGIRPNKNEIRALRQTVKALKWRFDEIHAAGQKALAAGDYPAVRAALELERELTATLLAKIAARRQSRQKHRAG